VAWWFEVLVRRLSWIWGGLVVSVTLYPVFAVVDEVLLSQVMRAAGVGFGFTLVILGRGNPFRLVSSRRGKAGVFALIAYMFVCQMIASEASRSV
jgi:hypothetical protein